MTKEAGILQELEYKNKKQIIHKFHCCKCEEIYNKRAAFPGFVHLLFASCRIAHCTQDSILLGRSMQTSVPTAAGQTCTKEECTSRIGIDLTSEMTV